MAKMIPVIKAKEWDLSEKPLKCLPKIGDKVKVISNFSDHNMLYGDYTVTNFFNRFEEEEDKTFDKQFPYVVEVSITENEHGKRNVCLVRDTTWFSEHFYLSKVVAGRIIEAEYGRQILFFEDRDVDTFLGKYVDMMGQKPDYQIFKKKEFAEFNIRK